MGKKCPKCSHENPDNTKFCGNCASPLDTEAQNGAATETLMKPIEELKRGSILSSRYEIIEELGKGGMGKVYKAFDREIDENVAIKLIRPEISANKKIITRFQNELRMARKIAHRNVCRMYDIERDGDTIFITMEYVPGEDLKTTIRRMGSLTIAKAISIAKQICEGLAEAHRMGIVHRDLKPRNVMVDREGNVRIMDFGIAVSQDLKGITDPNIMIGTPQYMSPEQVSGKEIDERSDIYSLGVILFEMVTGQVPFDGDTTLSIAVKHKTDKPPDPRDINFRIPEELSRVILRCLEKEKEQRYQNIDELLSELRLMEKEIPTRERIILKETTGFKRKRLKFGPVEVGTLIFFAVVILVFGYLYIQSKGKGKEQEALKRLDLAWTNSIAILPFKNLSPTSENEYLSEAMVDSLIIKLRSISPDLKVMSKRAVLKYKDMNVDVKEIGQQLSVALVLEGSLQVEGDRILVNAWLTNASDNSVLLPFKHELKFESVLDVQDEIAYNIAKKLQVHMREEQVKVLEKRDPEQVEAYEYYAKGRYYERVYRDNMKEEDFEMARQMYEKTIEIEPGFPLAYTGLGNLYEHRYVLTNSDLNLEFMLSNYKKAYEHSSDLAETNAGMGWYYFYHRDNDKAYEHHKRAFELDPNDIEINLNIGSFLRSIGLFEKSVKYYSRAIELDPFGTLNRELRSSCNRSLGELDKAIEELKEIQEMRPDDQMLRLKTATSLVSAQRYDEAERAIQKVEQADPENFFIRIPRAMLFAVVGEKDEALSLIEGITIFALLYPITDIYAALGMKDIAVQRIEEGRERGFEEIKMYLYTYQDIVNNPLFASLKGDPRFQEIVEEEKQKYEEMLAKYTDL
ncbi:protein kinase [Acidobacteriota bacterium]